jgi:hypothetical protein
VEEAGRMSKKQHVPEEIVKKLREAEMLLGKGIRFSGCTDVCG